MDDHLKILDDYILSQKAEEEKEQAAREGKEVEGSGIPGVPSKAERHAEGDAQLEEKENKAELSEQPPKAEKGFSFKKLKNPGSIAIMLGLILFIVFAISPAFPGSRKTRLELLMEVIARGGIVRPGANGGVQPFAGMNGNGSAGADYNHVNVITSGSLYSSDGGILQNG